MAISNIISLTHPWRSHARRYRADVDVGPFGGNDEVRERLHDAQRAPDINFVHTFRGLDIGIKCWHDNGLTGIVDEVVELAACGALYFLDGSVDAGSGGGA